MKNISPKKDKPVMALSEELPFTKIDNLPEGWFQKHHWILNDKYVFGIAMVHDYKDGGKVKYSIANKHTGEYFGGKNTFQFYNLLNQAIEFIKLYF
jgi:hypothetical protein